MDRESLVLSAKLLQVCPLQTEEDIVDARSAAKMHARELSFSVLNQTKVVTAASELCRNVIEHGKGGSVQIDAVQGAEGPGIRMIFKDSGPGIDNLELALTDGYSSQKGMGLGLTGSKRLMDVFELQSEIGVGTTVSVIKWK